MNRDPSMSKHGATVLVVETTGWEPTCKCDNRDGCAVPCTVLDPFAGLCTTLLVAQRLKRVGIGIELNAKYVLAAADRLRLDPSWGAE